MDNTHFLYTFAFALLLVGMFASLGGAALGVWRQTLSFSSKKQSALGAIEMAGSITAIGLTVASAILLYAFISYDFSVVYVASYSDTLLPLFYRITAFWAGQPGSLLFWAFSVALCGWLFQYTPAYLNLTDATKRWYWVFFHSIMGFFCLLLTTWNNPFLVYSHAPFDGNGLNPLLQNPGMIFHPPLLFLGYGGFVIPGCLALAQALSNERDNEASWTTVARPFTMAAWAFLTVGIVLGAWWAYMELGWGGYWAWDPVENASLIPWLIATAVLHTLLIDTRRGKLRAVNTFLMALTTISAFFATYLVRSGVVQSVHAFGDGGVGAPLLLFILFSTVIAFWIAFATRDRSAPALEGIETREGFLVLTSWLLLALGVIILVATMWPVFTAFWNETIMGLTREVQLDAAGHDHGGAQGLTATFYNRVCLPLFAGLAALLAICPWLRWSGGLQRRKGFFLVLASMGLAAGALWGLNYRQPTALLGIAASVGVVVGVCLLVFDRNVRRVSNTFFAYLIHAGVALMVIGVGFSGPYKLEREVSLTQGESVQLGQYQIQFTQMFEGSGPGFHFIEGELKISKNGTQIGILTPQRRIYDKWNKMQFAEASTQFSLGNELYASLLGLDQNQRGIFRISSNPLVNWIWIGGALLSILPFFMMRTTATRREADLD